MNTKASFEILVKHTTDQHTQQQYVHDTVLLFETREQLEYYTTKQHNKQCRPHTDTENKQTKTNWPSSAVTCGSAAASMLPALIRVPMLPAPKKPEL